MINPLTPDEKLNLILTTISNAEGQSLYTTVLTATFAGNQIRDSTQIIQAIKKLQKDEYIESLGSFLLENGDIAERNMITFEGEQFLSHGGYVKQQEEKDLKEINDSDRNRRMERNEVRLVRWTRILAIGSVCLLLWEMLKYFCLD